jgi:hypothetical protein
MGMRINLDGSGVHWAEIDGVRTEHVLPAREA